MDDDECAAVGGIISRGNGSIPRNPAQVPLCPPEIPHDLTRDRTQATVVGSQQLPELCHGIKRPYKWSRDRSVGIATGYRHGCPASIPGSGALFSTWSRPTLGPTQPHILSVPVAFFPGIKRQGCESDHSPSSSAEVKKGRAIPPLCHMSSWYSA
jgi:hypothetical protein